MRAQQGSATYDGFAVANVVESIPGGPAAYVQGGRFSMTFDFDRGEGAATIAGILDQTVSVAVDGDGATGANHYGGSSPTGFVHGSGSGSLSGSFFVGDGDPVAATAGSFALQAVTARGAAASAAGVYGADRKP